MLPTKSIGAQYHAATHHSYRSVLIDPNYVDASTQPSPFKIYPKFYRRFPFNPDDPTHSFLRLTSTITFNKHYKEGLYPLRVNPSAGALFPTEIYVQLRGVKGMIDGIYHLEVVTDSLTLIYELIDDGLEAYIVPDRIVKGFIFLVSCVYFRSSWKYKNRSFRYCLLDSGHHLGAIEASATVHDRNTEIIFEFDRVGLNQDLGFENKEFGVACVIIGETREKSVRRLRSPIPFVSGTDYFEPNSFVEEAYQATLTPPSPPQIFQAFPFPFDKNRYSESILNRRSARRFKRQEISQADFSTLLQVLEQPLPTTSHEAIEIYIVVNRVKDLEPGLYRHNQLLQAGDFSEKAGYLCINQAIARDSALTLFFTATATNYQVATQLAGLIAHRLYLASDYLGLGCSGIGAYYDEETRDFLQIPHHIFYAMAIGL